jgi:riboflavin-specific deaminase-like protein
LDAGRPFVYVNMISTVDGRSARDGRSSTLGSDADLQRLLDLRTRADAVLIGTGTLRAEGYDRLVRREERRAWRREQGLTDDPLAVILSRSFDVPWEVGLFQAPDQPVLVYTSPPAPGASEPPEVPAPVEVVRLEVPSLTAMLADLHARGVRTLLSEGGPTLNGALFAAGLVDELYLTITPLITGDGDEQNIVEGGRLPADLELELLEVERVGSELFLRYGRAS